MYSESLLPQMIHVVILDSKILYYLTIIESKFKHR